MSDNANLCSGNCINTLGTTEVEMEEIQRQVYHSRNRCRILCLLW